MQIARLFGTGAALGVGGRRFAVTDGGGLVMSNNVGTAVLINVRRVGFMNCEGSKWSGHSTQFLAR